MDRNRLRTLAQAATPGRWFVEANIGRLSSWGEVPEPARVPGEPDLANFVLPITDRDARYMTAADPSTVLALLARLDEAEGLLRDVDACGVEWQNEGRYRTIQMDLPTSDAIRAFLAPSTPTDADA